MTKHVQFQITKEKARTITLYLCMSKVETAPSINQKQLAKFAKERDILLVAYSPLRRPDADNQTPAFVFDDRVKQIADKYKKTTTQIVLRYLVNS